MTSVDLCRSALRLAADIFWKTVLAAMRSETEVDIFTPDPREREKGPGDTSVTARSRRLQKLRETLERRGSRGPALAQTGDPDRFQPLVECSMTGSSEAANG